MNIASFKAFIAAGLVSAAMPALAADYTLSINTALTTNDPLYIRGNFNANGTIASIKIDTNNDGVITREELHAPPRTPVAPAASPRAQP